MTLAIVTQDTPGTRAMRKDAEFPDVPFDKQAELSLIAARIAELLTQADALHGVTDRNTRSAADVIVAMRQPALLDKAERAAAHAGRQVIHGACDYVAKDWESHREHWFLEDRLMDVEARAKEAGESSVLVYWLCLREPFRFCDCGRTVPCQVCR